MRCWCMSITRLISIRKELFSEFLLFDGANTNEDFMSIFPAFYDDLKEHIITYMKTMKQSKWWDHQAHDLHGCCWGVSYLQLLRRQVHQSWLSSRLTITIPNPWSIFLNFYCTDNFEFTQMIQYNPDSGWYRSFWCRRSGGQLYDAWIKEKTHLFVQ